MNRLERLYAIHEEIRRGGTRPVSASRLAERFEVSQRTIERDLVALRQAGAPLYADRGRSGGQRSIRTPDRVMVSLSVAEISALVIALAAGGPDLPYSDAGATATARLLDGLPDVTRHGVEELRGRIRTRRHPQARPLVRVRRTLEQAVQSGMVANIDYCDREGQVTTRSVDCTGFVHGEDGWYLVGWCHLRQAGRMFRLDRITSARSTRRRATERDLDATLGWVPFPTIAP